MMMPQIVGEGGVKILPSTLTIDSIAYHRPAEGIEVSSDLMSSAGAGFADKEGCGCGKWVDGLDVSVSLVSGRARVDFAKIIKG